MMGVFFIILSFVSVIIFWGIKNALIFYLSIFYGKKVNLVGILVWGGGSWSKIKISNSFQNDRQNKIKNNENGDFYVKPVFEKTDFEFRHFSNTNNR